MLIATANLLPLLYSRENTSG